MQDPVMIDSDDSADRVALVEAFFDVDRACLVGASDGSRNPWSFNARMTRTLMGARLDHLDLVGRSPGEIDGRPVVTSVSETDGAGGGLCVLVVRASLVVPTIREALSVGWDRFLIISELDDEERAELATVISESVKVWGPNCVGYTVSASQLTFMATDEQYRVDSGRGRIALVSQSGGAVGSMAPLVGEAGLDVSHLLSVGEEAGVGIEDVLEYFAASSATDGVVLFVEEARRPAAFLRALRRCAANNLPVTVVKVGRSAAAQQAAKDHTGALAGDWEEFAAAVRAQGGIIARSFRDAVHATALLVNNGGVRPGGSVAVFTSSGGSGALAADLIEETALHLSPLRTAAPAVAGLNTRNSTLNPFDSATGGGTPNTLRPYLEALQDDPSVDSLLFLTSGGIYGELICETLTSGVFAKPIVFVSSSVEDALRDQLNDGRILVAPDIADAISWMSLAATTTPRVAAAVQPEEESEDDRWSTYAEGTRLLAVAGVPRPATVWLNSEDLGEAHVEQRFPVVVKAGSLRGHKARYGGVRAGVQNQRELEQVMSEMSRTFPHLVVEEHMPEGAEILVTATAGPFGGMLVIGFGGKHVDALGGQVVINRAADIDAICDAIDRTPVRTFLESTLTDASAGVRAIADVASSLAAAVRTYGLESIEVNPVVITDDGATACDVKVRKPSSEPLDLGTRPNDSVPAPPRDTTELLSTMLT